MRIPKKRELLELQKKYRTDRKIGDVYGVPARLVAYWRAKKKIGAYSFPKYSEEKIQELWERYGDDAKAGAELEISKAGFRQWRRRYDINNKPLQLKLEQLELPLPDANRRKPSRRESIAQKILSRKAGLKKVEIGEVVYIEPDLTVSHSCTGMILKYFGQTGASKVWDPSRIAIVLDSYMPDNRTGEVPSNREVREFVKKQKIREFYDLGNGICHQVILERALVLPGQVAFSPDSQAVNFGSIGAFGSSLSAEEIAAIWATGRVWLKVPETTKAVVSGRLAKGVYAKDIGLKLLHDLSPDKAAYRAIEIYGVAVSSAGIAERLTITNQVAGSGCKATIIPFDDVTARFMRKSIKTRFVPVSADSDAYYSDEIEIDINYLTPQVVRFNDSETMSPVEEAAGRKIDQVIIGCCSNGRSEDLEVVSRILRGRHISRDVRVLIIPGSRQVLSEALDRGYIRTFIDSGCMILNPGCGSCVEAHSRLLEAGDRAVTTANPECSGGRNSESNEILVASPATAAATALEGAIADPRKYVK